jgi:hypothetical protein
MAILSRSPLARGDCIRILIIEDEKYIARSIAEALNKE